MGTITAKQLKQKTGEVIRRIKAGERLTLTYRGKAIAIIEPAVGKTLGTADQVKASQKAWKNIEAALDQTKPEFKSWREATGWVRKRP